MNLKTVRFTVCLVLCLCGFGTALADSSLKVDIPAGELKAALDALSKQSGADLVYRPEQVKGLKTHGAHGALSVAAAVKKLLEGTGLEVSTDSSGAMLIAQPKRPAAGVASPESTSAEQPSSTKEAGKNSSQDFRVAQVDQGAAGPEVIKDQNSERMKEEGLTEIVVTGTHLRGVPLSSPVQIITRADIDRSGYTSVGDIIQSIPQDFSGTRSNAAVSGSAPSSGFGSLSNGIAPDLRGLGTSSTLTLVDGHRLAEDFIGGVDISLIPLDAIERVEAVTDGASTIYGSDAVAGVVNFILKKPFDGAQTSGLLGGATEGGARERSFNQLLGRTWNGGGFLFDYEHFRQDSLDTSDRSFTNTAPTPWTILPRATRDSFLISADQAITDTVSSSVEAIYAHRLTDTERNFPPIYDSPTDVNQMHVNAGFVAVLPASWKASLEGGDSVARTSYHSYVLAPPAAPGFQDTDDVRGETRVVELIADGPIPWFVGEPIRTAIGAGFRHESYDDTIRGSTVNVKGDRSIDYAFGELNIPIVRPSSRPGLRRVDLIASGRWEHYSDFGDKAVPKVGLLYQPLSDLSVRSTWGKSFRAPTLYELGARSAAAFFQVPDPQSFRGASYAIVRLGGSPTLKPETARSWTFGVDYTPASLSGLRVSLSYFNIDYANRIENLSNYFAGLSDPANAPWVARNPSGSLQQAVLAGAHPRVYNLSGNPEFDNSSYLPSDIAALINGGGINVAEQHAHGADLSFAYSFQALRSNWDAFLSGAYLRLEQQTAPLLPEQVVAGTAFNPPKLKMRGGITWMPGEFKVTGIVNYLDSEVNTYLPDRPPVASWTTVDFTVTYAPETEGLFRGFRATFAVQNAFDRAPPFLSYDAIVPGIHYDSLNVTPLGRFLSLRVAKTWGK